MQKLLVIGAGYLGGKILEFAKSRSLSVIGSRRSLVDKEDIIYLDVLNESSFVNIPFDISHVVYCVSAGASSEMAYRDAYVNGVANMLNHVKANSDKFKIECFSFVSSTGVYTEDSSGEVTECSPRGAESFRSYVIKEAEDLILSESNLNSKIIKRFLILRFSGIYGPSRKYLFDYACSLSSNASFIDTYTNRIHVHDGALATLHLLLNQHEGVFNISDSSPSLKSEVINYIRELNNLNPISFINSALPNQISSEFISSKEERLSGKKVLNSKLLQTGFSFKYPSFKEGYRSYLALS